MRSVRRSALVPYSARQMFELVDDFPSYPDFLPWCSAAEELSRDAEIVEASMTMQRGGVRQSFRTRNTLRPWRSIRMELVDGLFSDLSGGWTFTQLGEDGCKVELDLDFEFSNRFLDRIFGSFVEDASNTMIDSFSRRALHVYGR